MRGICHQRSVTAGGLYFPEEVKRDENDENDENDEMRSWDIMGTYGDNMVTISNSIN